MLRMEVLPDKTWGPWLGPSSNGHAMRAPSSILQTQAQRGVGPHCPAHLLLPELQQHASVLPAVLAHVAASSGSRVLHIAGAPHRGGALGADHLPRPIYTVRQGLRALKHYGCRVLG